MEHVPAEFLKAVLPVNKHGTVHAEHVPNQTKKLKFELLDECKDSIPLTHCNTDMSLHTQFLESGSLEHLKAFIESDNMMVERREYLHGIFHAAIDHNNYEKDVRYITNQLPSIYSKRISV